MKRIFVSMIVLLPAVTACEPMPPAPPPVRVEPSQANYLPAATVRPDVDPTPSAVDAAMMWAERYNTAIGERDVALDRARTAEHDQIEAEKQVRQLQNELLQVNKELDDANKMLRELKGELDKWKRDVLGFRKEIMEAQTAQLDALRQIMKVLGSELGGPANAPAPEADQSDEDDE